MMMSLIVTYDSNKILMRKKVWLYISALHAVDYIQGDTSG